VAADTRDSVAALDFHEQDLTLGTAQKALVLVDRLIEVFALGVMPSALAVEAHGRVTTPREDLRELVQVREHEPRAPLIVRDVPQRPLQQLASVSRAKMRNGECDDLLRLHAVATELRDQLAELEHLGWRQ